VEGIGLERKVWKGWNYGGKDGASEEGMELQRKGWG